MSRRRFWLSICMALAALLSLLAGYASYRVQLLLDAQQAELDWQSFSVTWRGLQLHEVSLVQRRSGELHARAEQLQLQWLASEAPRYRLKRFSRGGGAHIVGHQLLGQNGTAEIREHDVSLSFPDMRSRRDKVSAINVNAGARAAGGGAFALRGPKAD